MQYLIISQVGKNHHDKDATIILRKIMCDIDIKLLIACTYNSNNAPLDDSI